MISIASITRQNAMTYKAARLRALLDTPKAFGSTYARESQLSDDEWVERAAKWGGGEQSAGYLAMDDAEACGIAAAYFDAIEPARPYLVSMWVAPSHRRLGIGRMLVETIMQWARGRGVRELLLEVTDWNEGATSFYQRLGFAKTGKTRPYPNDPSMIEYEMAKPLSP